MIDNINKNNASLVVSATSPKQYPKELPAEIVLVGKSNVGKSSFVNSMLNRKKLARTSNTPGKTRQINFYNIDDKLYFVDLPGYGYSKMSKIMAVEMGKYIEEYLKVRDISLIVLLLDIRHKPTNDDKLMYEYILKQNLPFVILCNKADKIAKTKVQSYVEDIKKDLGISYSPIFAYSSENKMYVDQTWKELLDRVEIEENEEE
ncbi:MAG: YihA family ribosome biogenesis GTP-binding protein [Clostridiales bacterium]|nr:YihA family ribosome biogenesis GTP-binding protein [Clostridiales bacterium]